MPNIETNVTASRLADVLCCALEGGSNYWYLILKFEKPPKIDDEIAGEWADFRHIAYPLSAGGALVICDRDDPDEKPFRLTREALFKGAQIMAEKYPRHFADMVAEEEDADTGDCLLQCALFGEEIYA